MDCNFRDLPDFQRALMIFKDVPLRTRRAPSPEFVQQLRSSG